MSIQNALDAVRDELERLKQVEASLVTYLGDGHVARPVGRSNHTKHISTKKASASKYSTGITAYWDKFTPEERAKESRRRAKKRAKTIAANRAAKEKAA